MTGGLTYTTAGTLAEIVKGGATANNLTAASGTTADSLIGGAGADTLTANKGLDVLTGNGGTDTFVIQSAGTNLNTYSTITDASAGDTLKLANKANETFTSTKVVLGDTAVFQDYANAVATAAGDASTNGAIGWFQFNNNTYVVAILHDASGVANNNVVAAGANAFLNGTDIVVKLTGLIDLSTATLANISAAPLLLIH
jgi:S-layer protein